MARSEKTDLNILTFGAAARQYISLIEETLPDARMTHCRNRRELAERYDKVDVLVGWQFPDHLFARLPDLQWIQNLSVGIDAFIDNPDIGQSVRITNTARLYGDPIAEYIVWAMLTLFRRFHVVLHNQRRRHWEQVFGERLAGKTLAIAGLGDIGSRLALKSRALGMHTLGFARPDLADRAVDGIDRVLSIEALASVVGECDALVLCLPLTPETRGLVGRDILARMKPESILVNASRAELADQSAIVDAVKTGSIAGAALDVFNREPLRRWDSLWGMKNILVTPHTASMTSEYKTRVADLLRENMLRFADGQPLINEIDRKLGF